ncbi:hypothetical protein [Anaeromyxobacter oryzisoli]|uniref:hypothetical protein n=1 Tax=Anaeromyxobacter oryzisoli TaxID=2925408 RepID=UPI001F597261|nr:hypothetical protein [Anaeromyxobacter sp. SG63]
MGGYAAGETFSVMWAVIGAIVTLGAAFFLGWRFHVAEEKKKREELPPEIRGVFDRMLGVERDASGRVVSDPNGVFSGGKGSDDRRSSGR